MSQKVLHINSRLTASAEEFAQDNGAESAQALVDVPGLLWKIAYISHDQKEAGGFYLFKDEATLRAYAEGPIVAELAAYPLWTDMRVRELDILVDFSKVLRAPIGEKYEPGSAAPKSFGGMVKEALHAVPALKAADLQRRQKKEADLLVIDVRDAADLAQTGTVPGAINISYGALTYMADNGVPEAWRDPRLADRSRPIVTTCILGPLGALGGKLFIPHAPVGDPGVDQDQRRISPCPFIIETGAVDFDIY